jgi:hypothetical protein
MNRREFMGTFATISVAGPAGLSFGLQELSGNEPVIVKSGIPKRVLGKTGVEIPALVIGGVAGMALKPTSDFHPAELANAALDAGITYFDTAPSYANGQSELNYGEIIATRRKEIFLTSKTLSRTYDGTMRDIEASLKRLQTDHVDLYQVHSVTDKEDITLWGKSDGMLKAFHKLRDEKVIRFMGVTGHESAEAMNRAIEMYEFDTILTTFNPVLRRKPFRESVLQNAKNKNMGIIAMKVMGGGGGALAKGNPAVNVNGNWYWDETRHQVDASMLIRYALGLQVSCAVIGMKSLKELEINVSAARDMKPLTKEEQFNLENIMS